MNVREMIEWLKTQDQDAIVEVVVYTTGSGYYNQGGNASTEEFTADVCKYGLPKHYEYDDRWKNKQGTDPIYKNYYGKTFLLLGEING